MRIRLEKRREPSRVMLTLSPVFAVVMTMIVGAIIFWAIGYDGPRAVGEIFFTPVLQSYKWPDVAAKAAPLILIALGLTLGNQAKVWNIGAEGQYLLGALGGAGVALLTQNMHGPWIVPLMIVVGMMAGAAWAAPVAWLRNRYGVNEILSSLMLVYVAAQVLNYLVTGPWKDPNGQNFPQTAPFTPDQLLPAHAFGLPFPPGLYIAIRAGAGVLARDGALGIRAWRQDRRRGAEGRALRRLQDLQRDLEHAADLRRDGWTRGRSGSDDAIRPAQPRLPLGLRLHRDHRLVPRPAAPHRHRAGGHRAGDLVCRRAGGADDGARAERNGGHLSGDDAVLHSGERCAGAETAAGGMGFARAGGGAGMRAGVGMASTGRSFRHVA